MCFVHARTQDAGRRREVGARVHADGRELVVGAMRGRRPAVVDDVPDRVGQLELALRVPSVEPVERAPQRRRAEDVGGRVQLADRALLVRRVPFLDHAQHPAGPVANHTAIRERRVGLEREERGVGVGAPVLVEERSEQLGREERRVAREDEDVALESVEGAARGGDGVSGAARLVLDDDRDSVELLDALRGGDDD